MYKQIFCAKKTTYTSLILTFQMGNVGFSTFNIADSILLIPDYITAVCAAPWLQVNFLVSDLWWEIKYMNLSAFNHIIYKYEQYFTSIRCTLWDVESSAGHFTAQSSPGPSETRA